MTDLKIELQNTRPASPEAPAPEVSATSDEFPELRIPKLTLLLVFATTATLGAFVIPSIIGMITG